MKPEELQDRLRGAVLVADGAMGSLLYEALGVQPSVDALNASQPDVVFRIHCRYIEAGAQIIETNTFGANRFRLAGAGFAGRAAEFNHLGMKIAREAREAARREVLIAGSIGPLGIQRRVRKVSHEEMQAAFLEQAGALEERGADLFILETFTDLEELLAAVDAIRSFSSLPVVAQMTFSEEGTAFDGTHPAEAWGKLAGRAVQAIGANCSIGPQSLLPVLEGFAAAAEGVPLSAMPNAGFPKRMGDRTIYPHSSPEYFAQFAADAVALGVRILGGCCGTTPDHIHAMAEAVGRISRTMVGGKPATRAHPLASAVAPQAPPRRAPESGLWKKMQAGQFVVTLEIDPPKGVSIERVTEQLERVMAPGRVDAVDINSGSLARVGMDALVLAGALEACGIETVPHLTTRDANIIGLQAMLLGAWAVGGVRNVLGITGDPPSFGDHPETSGVYELDSTGLVRLISRLNQGCDWAGKELGGSTNFAIGVAVNPVADDLGQEIRRFEAKIAAGAHFAMTQPLFDPAHWHAFVKRLGGKPPIPVLAGIWPLTSYKQALRLNNEVPGIVIPQGVLRQMEAAGNSARDCGFALARTMLDWARTELAGAYLVPPFKRYEEILELFG